MNSFILLAHQMGLIDSNIQQFMPYVSKCAAWTDIQASHNTDNTVELDLEDFYGILGFLGIGLAAGAVITVLESLLHGIIGKFSKKRSKKSRSPMN